MILDMPPPSSSRLPHRNKFIAHHTRFWHCVAALVFTAAASLCWFQYKAAGRLPYATIPQHFGLVNIVTDDTFKLNDLLVQQIVQLCMQQQDTFIWLQQSNGRKQVAVWDGHQLHRRPGHVDESCRLFHIPLASTDRSIGLCTDAALYVQLLGGWIAPATDNGLQHAQNCGISSAVMFLEPLYEPWLNWLDQQRHVLAVYAPNFEQLFEYDRTAHKRMQIILCKVHRCHDLMDKYLDTMHSTAILIYIGHTSVDPLALLGANKPSPPVSKKARPGATPQQLEHPRQPKSRPLDSQAASQQQGTGSVAAAVQPLSMLHVRGKSGLKHTKQLLDCWLQHPEWPQLTVIGPMPNEQITGTEAKRYMAAPNIHVPQPGKQQGPNWPEFEPLPAGELSALQLSHAVHIMPSEREGFGHSINEGRAAGAVLLVPDHPPMNELVRRGSGILLAPHHTFSHDDPPVPVLGKYGNISASMSPEGICQGVSQVLGKSVSELKEMGKKARELFESDREVFVDNMKNVLENLRSLLQVAAAAVRMEEAQHIEP